MALFQAYFTDGEFLDADTLLKYADIFKLDMEKCRHAVTDQTYLDRIAARGRAWRTNDVTGE